MNIQKVKLSLSAGVPIVLSNIYYRNLYVAASDFHFSLKFANSSNAVNFVEGMGIETSEELGNIEITSVGAQTVTFVFTNEKIVDFRTIPEKLYSIAYTHAISASGTQQYTADYDRKNMYIRADKNNAGNIQVAVNGGGSGFVLNPGEDLEITSSDGVLLTNLDAVNANTAYVYISQYFAQVA